ncbi:hypothetical protein Rsub_08312 [Raphidocelis subcapitata]|uniref:Ubiquitin thioesterase OTU n=1 Tax=Raphidocelis subcapitata TaxID=307507 RepID=A0A2V0P5Y8_9CHLO|nr:hypothetical protein Rsub_08312 [Raphidocelis subcapitata]|eukprot:GBF95281.1 hypothetical protein Rsub_08312 [Raphidocelis subcapitata]
MRGAIPRNHRAVAPAGLRSSSAPAAPLPPRRHARAPPPPAALPSGSPPPHQQPAWPVAFELPSSPPRRSPSPDAAAAAAAGPVTRARLRELHALHRAPPAGFTRVGVKGDGACMFRSLVQGNALLRTGSLMPSEEEAAAAQQLRAGVVERLRACQSDIEPFIPGIVDGVESFDAYCDRMARPGTWGGEPELAMAIHVLGRPIGVWSPGPGGPSHIITYGEESFTEPPLHVLWSGSHYDLLIPVAPRSKL